MDGKSFRILLIEDDETIAEPLIFGLEREGFQVLHAVNGRDGLALTRKESPDLILLDVILPDVDGYTLCRTVRAESAVPILMLTARGQEMERVLGLEVGADDYIVKPFSFRELVARIRAALRRRALERGEGAEPRDRLVVGEIMLDRVSRQVWRSGRPIELRQREFDLLCVLMEFVGKAVSRQELLDRVWGSSWFGDPRTVDVHIRWLREKLEEDPSCPRYIQTVRGHGYRLVDPNAISSEPF
ncbi:MAG: response regulator transcription factor [Armatimonadota bacterium]|nr:response regulator transcription factor [Armatimonadota bacterium]MDR5704409.1 response regulator transcription factor [Armatimonadota bacterium]MDR7435974.1 response regulator transcription factor [Armatimonadota bacterium]